MSLSVSFCLDFKVAASFWLCYSGAGGTYRTIGLVPLLSFSSRRSVEAIWPEISPEYASISELSTSP
jgi:hypothetical protein